MVASVVATGVGLSVPWGAISPRQQPPASRSKPVTMPTPSPRYDFDGSDRGKTSAALRAGTTQIAEKRASDDRPASGQAVARLLAAARGEVVKPGFALDPGKSQQDIVVVDRRPIQQPVPHAATDVAQSLIPAVNQSESVPTSPAVRLAQPVPASPLERFPSSTEGGASIQNFSDRLGDESTEQQYAAAGGKSLAFSGAIPGFAEVSDGVLENLADVPRFRNEALPAMAFAGNPVVPMVDDGTGTGGLGSTDLAYQEQARPVSGEVVPANANIVFADTQELDLRGFEHPAELAPAPLDEVEVVPHLAVIDLTQEADYRVSVAYRPNMTISDQAHPGRFEESLSSQASDELTEEETAIAFSGPDEVPVASLQRATLIDVRDEGSPGLQLQPAIASAVRMPESPAGLRHSAQQTAYSMPVMARGVLLGAVPIRVGGAEGLSVSLAGLLSLVRPQMDAAQYLRLSGATSAADYVGLEQLRAAGFSVAFDNSTDSLVLTAR